MTLPGWNSLTSVIRIDSGIQVGALISWMLLVVCEFFALVWKKRTTLFTALSLIAFAIAVTGEVGHYQYEKRRGALQAAQDASERADYEKKLEKAQAEARQSDAIALAAQDRGRIAQAIAMAARKSVQTAEANANSARVAGNRASKELENLRQQLAARSLNRDQIQKILAVLRTAKPFEVTIFRTDDLETQNFANQIAGALKGAGWTVHPMPAVQITNSVPGVEILVHDRSVPFPQAVILQRALEGAGIAALGYSQPSVPAGQIYLWVGPKNVIAQ